MIIFLDFDGVLHPIPAGDQGIFCHLERFEAVLRMYPGARVVISSSWRLTYSWDMIVSFFTDDIQDRIIGMTPEIEAKTRHGEIMAWLDGAEYRGPWIALDDAASEFPAGDANLLLANPSVGFDDTLSG